MRFCAPRLACPLFLLFMSLSCGAPSGPQKPDAQDDAAVFTTVIDSLTEPGGTDILADSTAVPHVLGGMDAAEFARRAHEADSTLALDDLADAYRNLVAANVSPRALVPLSPRIRTVQRAPSHELPPIASWDQFHVRFPGSSGPYWLSSVGYGAAGSTAVVSLDHDCDPLCGAGRIAILRLRGGHWRIVGVMLTWIR